MFRGLEIKRLTQLLNNKQKQDEMQTGGWLTSKEVHILAMLHQLSFVISIEVETNWCPLTFIFSL